MLYLAKVHKYIQRLSRKDRTRIKVAIEFLEEFGPLIKPPLSKKITGRVHELRIKGQNSYRIFYTQLKNDYYLIHIFKKKSQKIPLKEIKTTLDRIKLLI